MIQKLTATLMLLVALAAANPTQPPKKVIVQEPPKSEVTDELDEQNNVDINVSTRTGIVIDLQNLLFRLFHSHFTEDLLGPISGPLLPPVPAFLPQPPATLVVAQPATTFVAAQAGPGLLGAFVGPWGLPAAGMVPWGGLGVAGPWEGPGAGLLHLYGGILDITTSSSEESDEDIKRLGPVVLGYKPTMAILPRPNNKVEANVNVESKSVSVEKTEVNNNSSRSVVAVEKKETKPSKLTY